MTLPFCVKSRMKPTRHNNQIFYSMIRGVTIDMMDYLIKAQSSPKFLFHQLSMQGNSSTAAPTFSEVDVPPLIGVPFTFWSTLPLRCSCLLGSFIAAFTQAVDKRLTSATFYITHGREWIVNMSRAASSILCHIAAASDITWWAKRLSRIASFSGVTVFQPSAIVHRAHFTFFGSSWAIQANHSS